MHRKKETHEHNVKGNVRWIHKKLQKMKWDLSEQEFLGWIKLIAKHNKLDTLCDFVACPSGIGTTQIATNHDQVHIAGDYR